MTARRFLIGSILVTGICLTAAYLQVELWAWSAGMAVLTVIWLVGLWRRSAVMPAAGAWGLLVGMIFAAGVGLSFLLVLLASLAFLSAWDLTRLVDRMQLVQDPAMAQAYARSHLAVLGAVVAVALLIGLVIWNVTIELPFAWIAGLTVLVLILVRVAISLLQRWE
jgi:hypothetical protein